MGSLTFPSLSRSLSFTFSLALTLTFACSSAKHGAKVETNAPESQAVKEEKKPEAKSGENPAAKEDPAKSEEEKKIEEEKSTDSGASARNELIAKLSWTPFIANAETDTVYSGFDGTNKFSTYIALIATGELPDEIKMSEKERDDFFSSAEYLKAERAQTDKMTLVVDPAFGTIGASKYWGPFRMVLVTSVKAGSTVVTAKYGALEEKAKFQITAYTPAQVASGKARYNTAVGGATPSPACASCHNGSGNAPSHSPTFLASYSDPSILSVVETGLNTDLDFELSVPHKWTFNSAAERASIVPYLRSIDPSTVPFPTY